MNSMQWVVNCAGCTDSATLTALENRLVALTDQALISIDRTLLQGGQSFVFKMNATNFLGETAQSAGVTVAKATVALPEVNIMGSTLLTPYRSEQVRVRAMVVLPPPCDGASRDSNAMSISWSLKPIEEGWGVSSDSYLQSATATAEEANKNNADQRVFTIPADTVVVKEGISYRLTVTAAAKETPEHTNTATATISPKGSDLVAAIEGGTLRRVGVDDPVIVSAVGSTDPDDPFDRGAGALTFVWQCKNKKTGTACADALTSTAISLGTTPSITLNHATGSWLSFNTSYELSVMVCAKGVVCADKNASTSTVVEVGAGSPPEVGISYCALERGKLVCGKPVPPKVNPSEKFVLEASLTTKDAADKLVISTTWAEVRDQLSATPSYFSTPLFGAAGAAQLGLVLKRGVMVANGHYTFRFEATNTRTSAAGLAQIQVVANAPPSSGSVLAAACKVNGTGVCNGGKVGYAAETNFGVSSLYWVDEAEDLPLTYSFGFFIATNGIDEEPVPSALGHKSSSNRVQSQFPLGNVTVVGAVFDRLGASAEGRDKVVVTIKPGVSASALVEDAASALEGMLEQADGEQVTRTCSMLAVLLNGDEEKTDGETEEGAAAASLKKQHQRASLLNSTVSAQSLMEVSPRAIEQQSSTMSMLAANPAELNHDGQLLAVDFAASLVRGSAEVGLETGGSTAQSVGSTISAVVSAGLLNDTEKGRAAAASASVRGTLQSLSTLMIAPAVAGEAPVEVHTPAVSLSASRLPASSLASDTPTTIAMSSGSVSGASLVLPANFSLEDSPIDIDATLIAWRSSPYAFDGTGSKGAGVVSASLKSGSRILNVSDLAEPIELQIPTADPAYWRELYTESICSNSCSSANDGTCDDGAAVTAVERRLVGDDCDSMGHGLRRLRKEGPKCAWGTDCADCGRRASKSSISLEPECTYWDEAKSEWSSDGCTFVEFRHDYNSTICACNHLTDFSSTFKKAVTVLSVLKDLDLCKVLENMDIVYSLAGLWLVYIFAMVAAAARHEVEKRSTWYRPNEYVRANTSLGFIEEVMVNPSSFREADPKDLKMPGSDILKKTDKELDEEENKKGKKDLSCCKELYVDCCIYSKHGFSYSREVKESHPWLSIFFSKDVYFFNRQDRITVLFCLLLGDMFLDALLYDGGGKLDFMEKSPAWSPDKMLTDMGLGIAVEVIMLPVYVGILYAFNWVVSTRERDLIYTHLSFDSRLFWLHNSVDMEIELYRRKLERGDDMSQFTLQGKAVGKSNWGGTLLSSKAGHTNNPVLLDEQINRLEKMIEARQAEQETFNTPLAWVKDRRKFKKKVADMLTKLHHARGELAPHEVMQRLRKDPITKVLYVYLVKPNENNYPKIHQGVQKFMFMSYSVAFLWCVLCSFYIFLYGLCGSVEEKEASEGGGYQCTGNGQDENITRKWVGSFIIFALVAMFFMSPLKIFISKILLPNYTLSEAEENGLRFEGDRPVFEQSKVSAMVTKQQVRKIIL
jgi:hypothetical protein